MGSCNTGAASDAPPLKVRILGRGERVTRLKKRLRCAAGALGISLEIEQVADDVQAAELGARHGPLVLLEDRILADGPEPVEVIQDRLLEHLEQRPTKESNIS